MSGQVSGNGVAGDQLRAFVERLEAIQAEIDARNDDKKLVAAEVRSAGFDYKTVRKVCALRKMDPHKREEEDATLQLYLHALGMAGAA